MSDTETGPFEGYHFAGGFFWVKGTDLTVFRRWEREHLIDYGADPGFPTTITGTAISEHSVHVIGKRDRETKEFNLTIKSDVYRTQEWERHRGLELLAAPNDKNPTPELRMRALIFETLNKDPPTAILFVYQHQWAIECAVPQPC